MTNTKDLISKTSTAKFAVGSLYQGEMNVHGKAYETHVEAMNEAKTLAKTRDESIIVFKLNALDLIEFVPAKISAHSLAGVS